MYRWATNFPNHLRLSALRWDCQFFASQISYLFSLVLSLAFCALRNLCLPCPTMLIFAGLCQWKSQRNFHQCPCPIPSVTGHCLKLGGKRPYRDSPKQSWLALNFEKIASRHLTEVNKKIRMCVHVDWQCSWPFLGSYLLNQPLHSCWMYMPQFLVLLYFPLWCTLSSNSAIWVYSVQGFFTVFIIVHFDC